ncbi:uncharacterized protein [Channa argus]|uniref:uncharacterized protein isoform X1 n=1 Tax=Channa argus TaxID=215402 RepID=UPI0035214ACB
MASRRATVAPSSLKNASTDAKSSKSGSNLNKAANSGTGKKSIKSSGTIVKSRYMQSAEKTSLSKSNSLTNDSFAVPLRPSSPKASSVRPKVGTPPRRSVNPHALAMSMTSNETEPSLLGKSILQSTFSDGHYSRPDFDISVIKDKTVVENAAEPERNPENEKRIAEMKTFQLAYLTAKMESNTAKLKNEAEIRILQELEEEEALHNDLWEKKRKFLLTEKNRLAHELLDLQIAALTPVAEAAKQFTKEYKSFSTAVDTTRHELPVKNFYIAGDRREFLDKAEACLEEIEKLLVECTDGDYKDNSTSLDCLRDIKMTSKDISQQLAGAFSELLELSSLVSRHTIYVQQGIEEGQLGTARTHELYCPKNSHPQRRDVATGGEWRQRTQEQWRGQGKVLVRGTEEDEQGKGIVPLGTCQTMCPTRELRDREAQNRLHRFEILAGTEKDRRPRGDPLHAVKEYSRPAAGKDLTNSTDLRPPAVLLKTVCYLIDDIAASPTLHPWSEVYSFVFDRMRGVKQDMIIQRVSGLDCVAILERTVRFLIYASYHLCGEPLGLYDPIINDTHLQENLSWLLDCYATGLGPHPNQEEFQALGLLYNLGSARATQHIMALPAKLRSTPSIRLALSINRAHLERNPVRLLRLAQRLNFLQCCALHRHLVTCRRDLLLIFSHAYSSRNCWFPLDTLAQLLSLDTSLTTQLCETYGMEVNHDNKVVFSKAGFTEPEQGKLYCQVYHSLVGNHDGHAKARHCNLPGF